MRISKVEAQALAAFIGRVRPDWQHPGIMAAIEKAAPLGSAAAIGAALCRLAENYELRTPAILEQPGTHWSGTTVASRQPPSMCPDHPSERASTCALCAADAVPPPTGWRADVELPRRNRPTVRTPPPTSLADTRARADAQETP